MRPMSEQSSDATFIRRVLILFGILAGAALLFFLSDILILVFGSIVVSTLLTALSKPIQRWLHLSRGLALAVALLLVLGIIGVVAVAFGRQLTLQADQLGEQIPAAWEQFRARLAQWGVALPDTGAGSVPPGTELSAAPAEPVRRLDRDLVSRLGYWLMQIFAIIGNTLLVLVGGIFLAAEPSLYRNGMLKLFPQRDRALLDDAYGHSARALQYWLVGTAISMIAVGILTWIGLVLLGVPSALALASLAALLEFVPFVGPVAAAIPAMLIAFTQGIDLALWTGLLFVVVQQIEGYGIQPIAQRYAVDLPPALLLFSIVAAGFLFGFVGILFAAPLTVVAYVLIKRLYVREALHTKTQLPDER
jgi:predicted PurR-regulated permease PerM